MSHTDPPLDRPWISQRENPWLVFLLPFFVFMLVQTLEPTPETPGGAKIGLNIAYQYYPTVYTAKIVATLVAVGFVWPGYRRFPFRLNAPLAIGVGVVGVVVWVGVSKLELEPCLLGSLGLGGFVDLGTRSGFNPLVELADAPAWAWTFLGVRLFGLAVVVALIEEFFLRGFVMRFVMERDWWAVPFGTVSATAVVVGTLLPMLSHPAELLAAAVWFLMVTWLMTRTRNIWDCVAAHFTTNLLLGVYVLVSGDWRFL